MGKAFLFIQEFHKEKIKRLIKVNANSSKKLIHVVMGKSKIWCHESLWIWEVTCDQSKSINLIDDIIAIQIFCNQNEFKLCDCALIDGDQICDFSIFLFNLGKMTFILSF